MRPLSSLADGLNVVFDEAAPHAAPQFWRVGRRVPHGVQRVAIMQPAERRLRRSMCAYDNPAVKGQRPKVTGCPTASDQGYRRGRSCRDYRMDGTNRANPCAWAQATASRQASLVPPPRRCQASATAKAISASSLEIGSTQTWPMMIVRPSVSIASATIPSWCWWSEPQKNRAVLAAQAGAAPRNLAELLFDDSSA